MAVLTSGAHLPWVLRCLEHPEIDWVTEFDYRPPKPSKSGSPHYVNVRRRPLLIYGKRGFQLQKGDDVVKVPLAEDDGTFTRSGQRLEAGMAVIIERLALPGQTVCDPIMQHRCDSALAAWETGRAFIGATDTSASLTKIKAQLSQE